MWPESLVEAFGIWGQRWISTEVSLTKLDVSLPDVGHAAQSRLPGRYPGARA